MASRERLRLHDRPHDKPGNGDRRHLRQSSAAGGRPPITLLQAIDDPHLFKPWFTSGATWASWFTFIAALFALPMTADQLAAFKQLTGRTEPPKRMAREAWLICGRRAGKSFVLALVAVFLACFHDYRAYLAPGERGMVIVVAADRKQARVILRYIRALLTHVPMLKALIERETNETIDLSNQITIEVGTASFKSVRGYTIVAALCDEIAFWQTEESTSPDAEILAAIRPGLATIPNAVLLCASSPYARKGALFTAWQRHYAKDNDPALVFQAPTTLMNPTVPQSVIDEAYERDPASAAAEYGAVFRSDIESFIAREAVDACVTAGLHERPPMSGVKYVAFADPSGGSGKDSFTIAIAHMEKGIAVLDAIRERKPPFSPEEVVTEFAKLLKSYRITKVTGDRYAGEWPRERFKVHSVTYDPAAKPKSDIYRDCLPLLNSRKVDLLDHVKLVTQIIGLERRTARSGKDSIDHAPGGHDDVANAVCGVLTQLGSSKYRYKADLSWVGNGLEAETRIFQRQRLQTYINSGGMLR